MLSLLYFRNYKKTILVLIATLFTTNNLLAQQHEINPVYANVLEAVTGADVTINSVTCNQTTGDVYTTGNLTGIADFNLNKSPEAIFASSIGGYPAIFFAKYDANANLIWLKTLTNFANKSSNSITVDASNNIYITGHFGGTLDFDPSAAAASRVSSGAQDVFLAKYDSNGNYIWANKMGGTSTEEGKSVAIDATNNVYITGYFGGVVDFDPSAGVATYTSSGVQDIFLVKYDTNGNYLWANTMGGANIDQGNSVSIDASNNAYITGNFNGTVDFDPSAGVANLSSTSGSQDIFLAKYDSNGNYLWAKKMGGTSADIGSSVALDASNNAYITGYFSGTVDFDPSAATTNLISSGGYDIFLAKYYSNGNYLWAKKMGGTDIDLGKSVVLDASNNAYITGYFNQTVDFDPNAGTANLTSIWSDDVFLAKYDVNGNYVNAVSFGSTTSDMGNAIALDASANVFAVGLTSSSASAVVDLDPGVGLATYTKPQNRTTSFVAKYNTVFVYQNASAAGGIATGTGIGNGANISTVNSINTDATGNTYVSGIYIANIDTDPSTVQNIANSSGGSPKPFFAKYNDVGNFLFQLELKTNGDFRNCYNATDAVGNIYLALTGSGITDFDPSPATANVSAIGAGGFNVFIAKYDASGNYLWAKAIGAASSNCWATGITVDASANIFLCGYTLGNSPDFDPSAAIVTYTNMGSYDMFLAKYDSNGDYQWANMIGSTTDERANAVAIDAAGNPYITGYFYSTVDFDPSAGVANLSSTSGSQDIFLAKYDSNGNYLWANKMGGTNLDVGNSVALDASANAYITGYFSATVDFDPSAATTNLISSGGYDIFLAKYDVNGNYVWAKKMGGTNTDVGNSVALDSGGNPHITGYFNVTADFDPSASVTNLISAGNTDVFIAKYDSNGNYMLAKSIGTSNNDIGSAIAVSDNGKSIYVGGSFAGTTDFDPDPNVTLNRTSKINTNMFFARYNYNYTAALHFDGTNDVATATGINLANRSFSISLWEKREVANRQEYFLAQGAAANNTGLHLCYLNGVNANKVRFGFWNDDLDSPVYTDVNTWHNWIFIYDNEAIAPANNKFIYRDGVQVAAHRSNNAYLGSGTLHMGHYFNGLRFYQGTLDEVLIWDTVLSPFQIQQLQTCGIKQSNHVIAHYNFNEGIPNGNNSFLNSVTDYSGNGHNLTITNFAKTGTTSNFVNNVFSTTCGAITALSTQSLSFEASLCLYKQSCLQWTTTQENDNIGYAVEKSEDGINFEQIAFVNSANNLLKSTYNYVDDKVQPGKTYYYKIKQEEINGNITYSNIENVTILKPDGIYFTQQNESLFVTHPIENENAIVNIYDSSGRIIKTLKLENAVTEINLQDMPKSLYIAHYVCGNISNTHKFIR